MLIIQNIPRMNEHGNEMLLISNIHCWISEKNEKNNTVSSMFREANDLNPATEKLIHIFRILSLICQFFFFILFLIILFS